MIKPDSDNNSSSLLKNCNIMLALTYQCQCHCIHCGAEENRKKQEKELTSEEIFKIIDDSHQLGAQTIYFFGGEPLLCSELLNYIKYAKKYSLSTRLDTNGYLLDEPMIIKLKGAGLDLIRVSLDSPHEITHDKLRGFGGLFQKCIHGMKLCKKHNLECYLSTYATKETLENGDIAKIIALGKSIGVKIRILSPICSGKWQNRQDLILNATEIQKLRNLLEKDTVFWEKIDDAESPFICGAAKKELVYISAHGDVQPCCYWPIFFGNIRAEPLDQIITKMRAAQALSLSKDLNDCPVNYHQR